MNEFVENIVCALSGLCIYFFYSVRAHGDVTTMMAESNHFLPTQTLAVFKLNPSFLLRTEYPYLKPLPFFKS